jgi:uncharacterized protein (TIGR02453 family)
MPPVVIKPASLDYMRQLAAHNNREWFEAHRDTYEAAKKNVEAFAGDLLDRMRSHDLIENESGRKSLFRIYRDVRFSKNKEPYKSHWSGHFTRATKQLRGGYYFHLEPGNSFLAGGFWNPNPDDLLLVRKDIEAGHEEWRSMLNKPKLKKTFGGLLGDQVLTAPRGFDKNHPAIELLRYKQFLLRHSVSDKVVTSKDFVDVANDIFMNLRPFFDLMSDILTSDGNGQVKT